MPNIICGTCDTSNGNFISGLYCKQCSTGCKTCVNEQQNQCNTCQSGYYYDSKQCIKCHPDCTECFGKNNNQCLKCNSGYIQIAQLTCGQCNSDQYNDTISCIKCPLGCSTCKSATECTSCTTNYYLRQKKCVTQCASDEFIYQSKECQGCNPVCKTCSGSQITDCTSCTQSNYYIVEDNKQCGTCNTSNGYFISQQSCLKCYKGCLTCLSSLQNDCTSCGSNYYFDTQQKACPECHPDCNECNGTLQNQCQKCKQSGNYLSLQDRTCKPCQSNEYNDQVQCLLCPLECASCLNSTQCTSCTSPYHLRLQEQKCVSQCNENEFVNSQNQCQICDPKCKTCTGPLETDCNLCSTANQYVQTYHQNVCGACDLSNGFFINSEQKCEKCFETCKQCSSNLETDCQSCVSQYFFNSTTNKCSSCNPDCDECTDDLNSGCKKCKDSSKYLSLSDRTCQPCQSNQYNDTISCFQCPTECSTCTNSTLCNTCVTPYHFRPDNSTCVMSCNEDEFVNTNNSCQACSLICKTCSGPLSTDCQLCKGLNNYVQDYNGQQCGICDTQKGYFILDSKCYKCYDNCNVCTGPFSTQCQVCDDQYFLDLSDNQCAKCDPDCDGCTGPDANQCKKCSQNGLYISLQTNLCVNSCQIGEYNDSVKCLLCPEGCYECTGLTQCSSCKASYFLRKLDGECVQQCHSDEYPDINRECQPCDKACKTCSDSGPTQCKSCSGSDQYIQLQTNLCGPCDLKQGNYLVGEICKQCYMNCSVCSGSNESDCTTCYEDFYMGIDNSCKHCDLDCESCTGPNNNQCKKCKQSDVYISQQDQTCKQCLADEYNDTIRCQSCKIECTTCASIELCTSCADGYYFRKKEQTCVTSCNSDEFINSLKECQGCHPSCKTCTGENDSDCTSCKDAANYVQEYNNNLCGTCDIVNGFYTQQQKCLQCYPNCNECNGSLPNQCQVCDVKYFLDQSTQKCAQCHPDCDGCVGGGASDCKKCKTTGLYLNSTDKTCKQCQPNEYNDTISCLPCPTICSSCTSLTECTGCSSNYYLRVDEKTCVSQCKDDEFVNSKRECQKCDAKCKTCTGGLETDCTACSGTNQYIQEAKSNLCGTCDTENGFFISGQKCLECFPNCLSCTGLSATDCQVCDSQYYLDSNSKQCKGCDIDCNGCTAGGNNQCKRCKSTTLYFSVNDRTCQQCQSNQYNDTISCLKCPIECATCDNQLICTSCTSDYFFQRSQSKCVSQCNSDQYPDNNNECKQCNPICTTCSGGLETDCTSCAGTGYFVQEYKSNQCGECDIKNGYFIQGQKCLKCTPKCQECTGPNETQCSVCLEQYFYNNQSNMCQDCHPDCDGCIGPDNNQCKKCKNTGSYLSVADNVCKKCNGDEFNDSIKCIKCPPKCSSCKNLQECNDCKPSFFYRIDSKICVDSCEQEEYVNAQNECILCDLTCSTCTGKSETDCLSCSQSGQFITNDNNKCGVCNSDQFGNTLTHKCQSCGQDCLTCSGPNNTDCNSCTDNTLYPCLDQKLCEKSCLKCYEGCNTCFGEQQDQCSGCSVGVLQSDNTCQKKCKVSKFYNEITNTCDDCNKYCKRCENSSSCQECDLSDPLTFVYNDNCYNCQPGQYFNDDILKCVECNSSCKTCLNYDVCLSCYKDTFLYEGECLKVCPDQFIANTQTNLCDPCKYEKGVCVLTCSSPFYLVGSICEPCSPNCTKCENKDNCLECIKGYTPKENNKIMVCQINNKNCKSIEDCEKQQEFKEKIDNEVTYFNQVSGSIQFVLTFTSVFNTPAFWYWSQSYQHIGNYDVYENDFDSYGLGSVYLRSFYKSYNVLPNIPLLNIFKDDKSSKQEVATDNAQQSKRLLQKKDDLNWDGERDLTMFNNMMYWSFGMAFILLLFLVMRFLIHKHQKINNLYIKKEEYFIRYVLFTSNFMLMQMGIGLQVYEWSNSPRVQDILGLAFVLIFTLAYSYSFFRLYRQSACMINDKQEFSSLFDRFLIKSQWRFKYFWIIFEIRKMAVILAFCIPKNVLISCVAVLTLDSIFLIYLFLSNPFTNRYVKISFFFQDITKVLIDVGLLMCLLTEFNSQLCFGLIIFLMFLNLSNLLFMIIMLTKKLYEYLKKKKNFQNVKDIQELAIIELNNETFDRTQRSTTFGKQRQAFIDKSSFNNIPRKYNFSFTDNKYLVKQKSNLSSADKSNDKIQQRLQQQ